MNPFEKAAKALPGHWTKDFMVDSQGNRCAVGHLRAALGMDDYGVESADEEFRRLSKHLMFLNNVAADMFPDRDYDRMVSAVSVNDHDDTVEEDVVAMLEKAAVLWDERIDS